LDAGELGQDLGLLRLVAEVLIAGQVDRVRHRERRRAQDEAAREGEPTHGSHHFCDPSLLVKTGQSKVKSLAFASFVTWSTLRIATPSSDRGRRSAQVPDGSRSRTSFPPT